jgi:two-component system alkaline phosphatase synthesis response regulator PhoP
MKKVLLVEDDQDMASLLEIHLSQLNIGITHFSDGMEALHDLETSTYDLIILDIMLPGLDGISLLQRIRNEGDITPVMLLTAKSEEIDKVVGLESGADDYLTKPFSVREFTARVKAMLRRVDMAVEDAAQIREIISYEDLEVDITKRQVRRNEELIDLTPKEFDLLVLLAANPGISYDRKQLLSAVWGYDFAGYEHTVNSHINRLRNKLEPDINKPKYVLTTWGIGYRFNDQLI